MELLLPLLFYIPGVLMLYPPSVVWIIKQGNMMRGTKTSINKNTILINQIIGVIWIIFITLFFLYGYSQSQ